MTTADEKLDLGGLEQVTEAIMTGGYTFQDFSAISDDEKEAAYATAYNLFDQGQYVKSEKMFEFLCQLDHYQERFWVGLGAVRQMLKNYEQAAQAYSMAAVHNVENPIPPLRAAECYLMMGQLNAAESGATAAIHWAGEQTAVKARAELLLDSIKKRRDGSQ